MLTTAVRDALLAESAIAAIVADRAFDYDPRRAGWEATPGVFDEDGDIRPTLAVTDGGDTRAAFTSGALRGSLFVWAFGPRTDAGRQAVTTIIERSRVILYRWQEPATGATLGLDTRIGLTNDDSGAVYDRATFSVGRIAPVLNW